MYLIAIYVRTSMRGQGVGSELLAQIIEAFPSMPITVRCLEGRRPFFERHGFVCEPERTSKGFFLLRAGPADEKGARKTALK